MNTTIPLPQSATHDQMESVLKALDTYNIESDYHVADDDKLLLKIKLNHSVSESLILGIMIGQLIASR